MSTIATQLKLLMPPEAYNIAGPILTSLLASEALALEDAKLSGDLLYEKTWPDTGAALEEWERVLGLPDTCVANENLTAGQRIASVIAKLRGMGGQSRAFYIQLAASLGYSITITEFRPARAGIAVAGDAINGDSWTSAWLVNAQEVNVFVARAGSAAAGEPLAVWGNKSLECRLASVQPAHTTLIFGYGAA